MKLNNPNFSNTSGDEHVQEDFRSKLPTANARLITSRIAHGDSGDFDIPLTFGTFCLQIYTETSIYVNTISIYVPVNDYSRLTENFLE